MTLKIQTYKIVQVAVKDTIVTIPEKSIILKNGNTGWIGIFPKQGLQPVNDDREYIPNGEINHLDVIELINFPGEEEIKSYSILIDKSEMESFAKSKDSHKGFVFDYLKKPNSFTKYTLERFNEVWDDVIDSINKKINDIT